MNLKPALSSSLCVKAVGSLMNVWTNCCCILLKKLISWIYPLILWVEDRDLREHSQQRTAGQPVLLFDCWFTLECVCQNLHVLTPRWNPTLQSSISTTCLIYVLHRQLMIFFSLPPTHPCSLIPLSCQSSRSFSSFLFSPLIFFSLVTSLIIPHIPLSLCFLPCHPPSCLYMWFLLYRLSPSWSTSSHPPSLSLPLPSLSASLAGCSLQWVSIMEAGSGAAAAVGSAALGLLGATATSSHDILDR